MIKKINDFWEEQGLSPHQKWRRRYPERARESDRRRRANYILKDPLRNLLKNVKSRAKASGIEFCITKDDLEWPEYCPVLGYKLERNSKQGAHPYSHSIDRIDNDKGYVPGNVKIISWKANSIKRDATIEEMEAVLKYMKEYSKKE